MTCSLIAIDEGQKLWVCGSYTSLGELIPVVPVILCYVCGRPATVLCDAPAGYGKTCDMPMCRDHSHNIGKDTDVCQRHYNDYEIGLAKVNRGELTKRGWPIQDNITCPACKSEEHSENAVFCKLCGSKLVKD